MNTLVGLMRSDLDRPPMRHDVPLIPNVENCSRALLREINRVDLIFEKSLTNTDCVSGRLLIPAGAQEEFSHLIAQGYIDIQDSHRTRRFALIRDELGQLFFGDGWATFIHDHGVDARNKMHILVTQDHWNEYWIHSLHRSQSQFTPTQLPPPPPPPPPQPRHSTSGPESSITAEQRGLGGGPREGGGGSIGGASSSSSVESSSAQTQQLKRQRVNLDTFCNAVLGALNHGAYQLKLSPPPNFLPYGNLIQLDVTCTLPSSKLINLIQVLAVPSGFGVVTLSEHTMEVTTLHFMAGTSSVLREFLDRIVRGQDFLHYFNFKMSSTPEFRQFVSEMICEPGSRGSSEIYRLLDILSGNDPFHVLLFSPTTAILVSSTSGKTLKSRNVFGVKGASGSKIHDGKSSERINVSEVRDQSLKAILFGSGVKDH